MNFSIEGMFEKLELDWDLRANREKAFAVSEQNGKIVHTWFMTNPEITDEHTETLGFYRGQRESLNGKPGKLLNFEVHSVRPVRRIGPDGQQRTDLVIEITQSWLPSDSSGNFRGGCSLIVDLEKRAIRYVVRKRVGHPERMQAQTTFQSGLAKADLGLNYFTESATKHEPFAMIHRGF